MEVIKEHLEEKKKEHLGVSYLYLYISIYIERISLHW